MVITAIREGVRKGPGRRASPSPSLQRDIRPECDSPCLVWEGICASSHSLGQEGTVGLSHTPRPAVLRGDAGAVTHTMVLLVCEETPGVSYPPWPCPVGEGTPGLSKVPWLCLVCEGTPGLSHTPWLCPLCEGTPGLSHTPWLCPLCEGTLGLSHTPWLCPVCEGTPRLSHTPWLCPLCEGTLAQYGAISCSL